MTRWPDADLNWLRQNRHRFPDRFCAEYLGRSENAVRIKGHHLRKEDERVEAARKLRNVSRKTLPTQSEAAA